MRLFYLEGDLSRADADRIAVEVLRDPVAECAEVRGSDDPHHPRADAIELEIQPRPGVMDPVADSTLAELRAEDFAVTAVRTARRYVVWGDVSESAVMSFVRQDLANDCIESIVLGTAGVRPGPRPPVFEFKLRRVSIRGLDDVGLETLSRTGHLFLSLAELHAIQEHFCKLDRDPTDLELETLAQTWSEHCVHKTLQSAIIYRGAALPTADGDETPATETIELRYENLLKDTIGRVTDELIAEGRGPQCLSVFKDNAGIIGFDENHGVAFKVETHNHPSAIEPYGGAATGTGGCIRDVIGCGLGAKPIANTDIFCVAPADWPAERLPKGVLHPRRVLRGIVKGVADYGNRMGIPTVNGAVYFDPRYLGNPLVYCGCVGLIPRDKIEKAARPGDLVVLIGGRTGRDGIHGATFSSAELTDTHADEFSHAVQIGNAITEKCFLDAVLRARDTAEGCLYTAITDCGAGGLSSAVGEMGERVGATIDLEKVPLKYAGLRYDEIWISEAQERMVLAVAPACVARLLEIMRAEEVEATIIGEFGTADRQTGAPACLVVRYEGHVVGALDMDFLHNGIPRTRRTATWVPVERAAPVGSARASGDDSLAELKQQLSRPNVAAKEWIIRQYDHEVQGGSVIKPLFGPGQGPSDAAVLRPVAGSPRGLAIGCGLAPHLTDYDPYWMAAAAIDEAVRNVVAVGGDPGQTAILDNFCWGRSDDERQLGALVRACQACYDVAKAYGVPFISGKDSLNNEFALDESDVQPLLETLAAMAGGESADAQHLRYVLAELERDIRQTRRLAIPGTLLISAVSIVPDVRACVSSDLKAPGNQLFLLGGLPESGFAFEQAVRVHEAAASAIRSGLVAACHDCSDGGWLTTVAEMAIGGRRGVVLTPESREWPPFRGCSAAYIIETADADKLTQLTEQYGVRQMFLGEVGPDELLTYSGQSVALDMLRAAWLG
ncbi:MAG: AIR synthase-related protein [Planctomycetota bacterium]